MSEVHWNGLNRLTFDFVVTRGYLLKTTLIKTAMFVWSQITLPYVSVCIFFLFIMVCDI